MYTAPPIGGLATVIHTAIIFIKGTIKAFSELLTLIIGAFT